MAAVVVEELQALDHPRIEAAAHVFGDLADDVLAVAKPSEFRARGGGPNRLLALFTLVAELHPAA